MQILLSVIVPTYSRYEELDTLLGSLANQKCNMDLFEVIIADQNDNISIIPLVEKFGNTLNLNYVKLEVKGISFAKNRGIEESRGSIITFADDDCSYYPDTISNVIELFKKNPSIDIFFGKLFDRNKNKNVMRNWKNQPLKLSKLNFHLNYCAITCFTRLKQLKFDEQFGIGSQYNMGEELDYIMQALNSNYNILYHPQIEIWHPELNVEVMPREKVYKYALGYGAVLRKNLNFHYFFLFLSSIFFMCAQALFFYFNNKEYSYKRYLGLKGRLVGFLNYK